MDFFASDLMVLTETDLVTPVECIQDGMVLWWEKKTQW